MWAGLEFLLLSNFAYSAVASVESAPSLPNDQLAFPRAKSVYRDFILTTRKSTRKPNSTRAKHLFNRIPQTYYDSGPFHSSFRKACAMRYMTVGATILEEFEHVNRALFETHSSRSNSQCQMIAKHREIKALS